jgi:uncharacterized protein (DUF427 family)
MTTKPAKIPGPDHPITIKRAEGRVTVSVNGRVVVDTDKALTLREASYPEVFYLPMGDVDKTAIEPSTRTSYCPYKGDASYFSIPAGGEKSRDAIWMYADPYPSVAEIKGHVAFYPNRVDSITFTPSNRS